MSPGILAHPEPVEKYRAEVVDRIIIKGTSEGFACLSVLNWFLGSI
jgi:hypothetical protein